MDTLQAIHTRRSIRQYRDEPVDEAVIKELLRAAMSAPSAMDEQPWHFVVITESDLLRKIPEFHAGADAAKTCRAGILVCHEPALEKIGDYWVQDLSAATQNLLLAAHAQGLGAIWIGGYPVEPFMEGFRELVSLPETLIPLAFVALGHPAEDLPERDTFREDRIHRPGGWGQAAT